MEESQKQNNTAANFMWKILERFAAQIISLIISIILARILSPEDYTVVGVVTIFFSFANVFVVGGLSTALIQKKNSDEVDYSIVLYTSLLLSLIAYAVTFFCAPFIAELYAQPILTRMLRIMGATLPITAIQSVWSAYVCSSMKFKKFFFSTLGATVISGAIGTGMAVNGFGAWALAAQQMSNILISTIILVLTVRIKIVATFAFGRFQTLWKYGYKVFLSSVISAVYAETTPLIIGLKFNSTDLSFYTKGRNFPGLISNTLTNALSAVLLPVFSKEQDDKRKLLNYLRKYIQTSSFLIFPLMMGFLCVSEAFVSVVLTEKWLPAVPYIRIFCIAYMFDMFSVGNCEVIKAMGRSDIFLLIEIIKKSLYFMIIIFFVFVMKSAILLALSAIACSTVALIVNSIPNRKMLGYRYRDQLADILPNLLCTLIMCTAVLLVGLLNINRFWLMIIQIVVGAAVYVLASMVLRNPSFQYSLSYLKSILKSKG